MATLTSTLTFTGIINGKTVTMSNTYTIEDIEDAADNSGSQAPDPILSGASSFPLTAPTLDYSAPQFGVFYNSSDSDRLELVLTGGATVIEMVIPPGGLFIINKSTDGGCFNESATATTSTFIDLDQLGLSLVEQNGPVGPWRLFAAYKNPAS